MSYKVSVLVPFYKVEKYIERCIRSLFEQTYPNLEYIFVDDCSPDNCLQIVQSVAKNYSNRIDSVKIVRHEKNRGLAAARNTAFDNATGEFICVVDSDDWMEKDGIERMVNEQIATNADVVWGKALMHTEEGEKVLEEPRYKDLEEWRMCYFGFPRGLIIVNWRRIIRRSLLEKHHIRHVEGLHIGNDKQLMPLIAYYAESFSTVDAIVYHYERRNPNAITYRVAHEEFVLFNFKRDVESMRRVIDFLADKEPRYLKTAQHVKLKRLLDYRMYALRALSSDGFHCMVDWIMETPLEYRKLIGWDDSFITKLRSNFFLSRFIYGFRFTYWWRYSDDNDIVWGSEWQ